jgi:hypothetical protein
MSEHAFSCPECSSRFVDCIRLNGGRDVDIDLQCSHCSHEWTVIGEAKDFMRL